MSTAMLCVHCGASSPSSGPPCPNCGKMAWLGERYRLEAVLSESETAIVYQASDREERSLVCVKAYLRTQLSDTSQAEALLHRMKTEETLLSELDLPHTPKLRATFGPDSGQARKYLVMTLFEGAPLRKEVESRRYTEPEVLALLEKIARLVEPLHALSPPVVHRDLSLDTVIRNEHNQSLALVGFDHAHATVGQSIEVDDHPGIRPPEAYLGKVSPKSDVYRLGLIALEMLARRDPRLLLGKAQDWAQDLSLSEPFAQRLASLLSEDPDDRPTVWDFLHQEAEPTEAPTPDPEPSGALVPIASTRVLPWTRRWIAAMGAKRLAPSRSLAKTIYAERSINPRLHQAIDEVVIARLQASYEVSSAGARDLLDDLSWDQEAKLFEDAIMASPALAKDVLTEWRIHASTLEDGAPLSTGAFIAYFLDVQLLDRLRPSSMRMRRRAARLDRERRRALAAFEAFSRIHPESRTTPPQAIAKQRLA